MKRILQERGLWYEGPEKQRRGRRKKNTLGMSFEERQFHEKLTAARQAGIRISKHN